MVNDDTRAGYRIRGHSADTISADVGAPLALVVLAVALLLALKVIVVVAVPLILFFWLL